MALKLGISLLPHDAETLAELTAALAAITRERADGLFVFAIFITGKHQDLILEFAARNRLPTLFQGSGAPNPDAALTGRGGRATVAPASRL